HPCPSMDETKLALGVNGGNFFDDFFSLPFGLYPSPQDVRDVLALFLTKSGWNGAPAIDLDVSEEANWYRKHPISPDYHIVFSIKKRGKKNTEQVAIGQNKSKQSVGNLIKSLIERTEPLRKYLKKELDTLMEGPRTSGNNLRIAELRRL